MNRNATVFIAGSETLIGGAVLRRLKAEGFTELVGLPGETPDLTDGATVDRFFAENRPEYVIMAVGASDGIEANQQRPAELIRENILVTCAVLHSAWKHAARKLLYLASSCSYPRDCRQPMRVEDLCTGPCEPTNDAYAAAKITGLKMTQAYRRQYGTHFICGIPANAFGPGDDFDPNSGHVIPALIHKMHEAKRDDLPFVEVWGTGAPRREFVYADDLAEACLFVMGRYDDPAPINLGGGTDLSIREVAERIRAVVGYTGELRFNAEKPDGMPLKALDSTALLAMGWRPKISFDDALKMTYRGFIDAEQGAHHAELITV